MQSLYLQYQFAARVPSIVDQARRQATFILSFGNPCNIREAHPCQDEVDPRYVRWIYTSARRLSPVSLILFPTCPASCLPCPTSSFLPVSTSRWPERSKVFSNSFFVPTPMLVCPLVRRNGQAPAGLLLLGFYGICAATVERSCCRNLPVVTFSLIQTARVCVLLFYSNVEMVTRWAAIVTVEVYLMS